MRSMHLIALVGADGMGKSTQARVLADRLESGGFRATCVRPVFLLFDPWKLRPHSDPVQALSPRERRLRGRWAPFASLAGYGYAVLTYAYIRAFLRHNEFVVCDRYFYQYFYDLVGRGARGLARAFPRPDVTFWLDGGLDVLLARVDRPPKDEAEARYFKDILEYYRGIAGDLGFVRIDAAEDAGTVGDRIWDALMREGGPRTT